MLKKVILAGITGGLTLMVWAFLINGFLGFRHRIDMKQVPNEAQVYQMLKQHITEPGRYLSSIPRKVFFVVLTGLLFAFFSDLKKYGIGNYPLNDTLLMTLHNIVLWAVLGLVIALIIKPDAKRTVI